MHDLCVLSGLQVLCLEKDLGPLCQTGTKSQLRWGNSLTNGFSTARAKWASILELQSLFIQYRPVTSHFFSPG